jgi:enoyl-CoA hydratase/carnithine racemase
MRSWKNASHSGNTAESQHEVDRRHMNDEIQFEVRNHVGHITLQRPAALNSLSLTMVQQMDAALRKWANDAAVHAVLVKGAGEKAFCAGGDIRSLYESMRSDGALHREFFAIEYRLDYLVHRYPKPYIAVMDGITMGGGMGISQGARVRIVSDRTRVAMPEVGIGFFPDVGGSYFLSRLRGSLGLYLGLTGMQLRAADTVYARLADVRLDDAALQALDAELDRVEWSRNPTADVDRLIGRLSAGPALVADLELLQSAIDFHFSKPDVPSIIASLGTERRSQHAGWAQQTLQTLSSKSPLMLCVTARQLQQARQMELADCLRMELNMVHRCFEENDFKEGIRAVLIDKDNRPQWQPAKLEEVSVERVAAFFQSRWSAADHPLAKLGTPAW